MKGPAKSSFIQDTHNQVVLWQQLQDHLPARVEVWVLSLKKQNSFNLLQFYTHISGNEGVSNSSVCFYTSFVQIP